MTMSQNGWHFADFIEICYPTRVVMAGLRDHTMINVGRLSSAENES